MALLASRLRGALGLALRVLQPDPGLLIFGLPPVELRLVPARIDHKEHVAFFHQLARLEAHLLDMTGNPRAHLDRFHGSVRPVNSSHSVISLCSTGATVTSGGAAAGALRQPARNH